MYKAIKTLEINVLEKKNQLNREKYLYILYERLTFAVQQGKYWVLQDET